MPLASFFYSLRKIPIHRLLFYLLILSLPTQLGKHFWFDFSQVLGIRIDYLSPTIYLTDVIVFAILISWFLTPGKWVRGIRGMKLVLAVCILLFAVVNILLAANGPITFYKWLKLLEFCLLGIYVSKNIKLDDRIIGLLGVTIIYSSAIAGIQFVQQGSIGGPLYLLGERSFTSATAGIASAPLSGQLVLRPYATFPHPNVLAGFIVTILPLLLIAKKKLARSLLFFLGISTVLLTLSRSAWFVGFILMFVGGMRLIKGIKGKRWEVYGFVFFFVLFFMLLVESRITSLWTTDIQSFTIRQELNVAAFRMIGAVPLSGVGLGNFIVKLPEFLTRPITIALLQPVHNIYLLIGSETGLLGLGTFILLIALTFRRLFAAKGLSSNNYYLSLSLVSILFLGLFDHYFATLQQAQLLFAIIVGLSWGNFGKT